MKYYKINEKIYYCWDTADFIDTEKIALPANAEIINRPPTPEETRAWELLQAANKQREHLFSDYDAHSLMYQRGIRLGVAGAAEKLAAWDAYAEALRAVNDTPDWYLSPQWPTPPEV